MYGSMEEKPEQTPLVPANEEHEMVAPRGNRTFFEGPFQSDFWIKVRDFYGDGKLHWSDALGEAHYLRLLSEADRYGKDPAVYLLVDCVNEFWDLKKPKKYLTEVYPSFEKEVSRMLRIILNKEAAELQVEKNEDGHGKSKYFKLLQPDEKGVKKTLLHIAAEQNLREAVKMLLDRLPGLQYNKTRGGGVSKKLPLDFALITDDRDRDEVAALLVRSMLNERIRELFQWDDLLEKPAKHNFVELVSRPNMKKTVVAVLDSMINPDWPFVLTNDSDAANQEKAWQTDPNLPIRYHFYYQILDQDESGRPPLLKETNEETGGEDTLTNNTDFNHRSKSGLAALSQGPHNEFAVKHPVVRVLANRKWKRFGESLIRRHAFLYALFLAFLSVAFLSAAYADRPSAYKKPLDFVRVFCEIGGLLFGVVYFLDELDQMEKERGRYWKDAFNYLDLFGLALLFICVPLRILDVSSQWITAAFTFMINFLRIFKYFCAWEDVGLYAKTLAKMLKQDMKVFGAVYIVVLSAFSGGLFLAMKATGELGKVKGFGDIILRGVRAVAEGKEFADDYDGYNVFVMLLILVNMLIIIVFLMNILIAQLSYRYESAKEEAAVRYDIDKIGLVARIENSRFRRFNLRLKHYIDGDYVNDVGIISDLITVWNTCLKEEGLDEKEDQLKKAKEGWTKQKAADDFTQ